MDETGQGNSKRKYISWLWSTSWFLLLFDSFYWVSFHYNTRIPSEVSQLLIFFFEGLWHQSFRGWWTLWMPTDQMNIRKKLNVQYPSWMDGWKHSRHVYLRVCVWAHRCWKPLIHTWRLLYLSWIQLHAVIVLDALLYDMFVFVGKMALCVSFMPEFTYNVVLQWLLASRNSFSCEWGKCEWEVWRVVITSLGQK